MVKLFYQIFTIVFVAFFFSAPADGTGDLPGKPVRKSGPICLGHTQKFCFFTIPALM
jgi:hypothetical protein